MKTLDTQFFMLTVGEILKQEREKKGINLSDIEKKIRVREKFLHAIEENDWKNFSSKIYIEGIIKNYARFLRLNQEKILVFFRRDYEKKEEVTFRKRISSSYLTPQTRKYLALGVFLVFILFFAYFGYQLKRYLTPPKLEILSPKTDTFKKETSIKVVGKVEKEATISIFGEQVYQNRDGIFSYVFPLKPGGNELVIEAVGANGKKTIVKKVFLMTR